MTEIRPLKDYRDKTEDITWMNKTSSSPYEDSIDDFQNVENKNLLLIYIRRTIKM